MSIFGKLSMDTSSRPSYVEPSAQASPDSAKPFVVKFYALDKAKGSRLIEQILTRFSFVCSDTLARIRMLCYSREGLGPVTHPEPSL